LSLVIVIAIIETTVFIVFIPLLCCWCSRFL